MSAPFEFIHFISIYGVWLVAVFIALESIGVPLPAEASLMAAAFFAARTNELDIWMLIATGISAAIIGDILGFWIGRTFGRNLVTRHGARLGLTEKRLRAGQWLFMQHGSTLVFTARFLPFLRNIAAVSAGTNCMTQHKFYLASAMAAVCWVTGYGLAAYSFGEAFTGLAAPAAASLGIVALLIVLGISAATLRYEKHLLAKTARGFLLGPIDRV
jgi:membrane protein DedA with SNARE-associated domain